jgi:hypothetical protein
MCVKQKAVTAFTCNRLIFCRSGGTRTLGPLIKSQLLYQLSYRPDLPATKVVDCFSFSKKTAYKCHLYLLWSFIEKDKLVYSGIFLFVLFDGILIIPQMCRVFSGGYSSSVPSFSSSSASYTVSRSESSKTCGLVTSFKGLRLGGTGWASFPK